MTQSIPASQLVSVIPGVLGAGGSPLSLNSVFLTNDGAVPIGTVQSFPTAESVADFFGSASAEAALASVYFNGFDSCTRLPGTLYFTQFNESAVKAYLRSGSLAAMTLAQLNALSAGTVIATIDGRVVTSASINLSAAASFSAAAALIQTGLRTTGGIFTGTANQTALSTTMTVTAVAAGTLHVGDIIAGSGVTVGTNIVAQLTGSAGGAGTYTVSNSTGFSSTTISVTSAATCTYDSQRAAFVVTGEVSGALGTIGFASGTLSAGIKLTSATGAVTSQGAAIAAPSATMAQVVTQTQNWALFMTVNEPLNATKVLFANWVTGTNDRYCYVAWDTDLGPTLAEEDADSFGRLVADYDGVVPVFDLQDGALAAFICGAAASINFAQTNGRITFAFKSQAGLTADVVDATVAANLAANGYNFYGSYATANQSFTFLQNGQISGDWLWIDPYVNQIYLNSQLQLAFMSLLSQVNSIPYNQEGYGLGRAAAQDPINEALNNGSIRAGITLSSSQAAQVNAAAGVRISDVLQNTGWYLQFSDPGAIVRAARGSPVITLWYTDGGSIQRINIASIDVL